MHPRTAETLTHLEGADWFSKVGVKDTDSAIVLSSWQQAMERCGSQEWQDLLLEAANQYCERLAEHAPDRFEEWNSIVAELKPITGPLVDSKLSAIVEEQSLPKVFEVTVKWDVLHLCMESEYADVYEPGFYASQAYWYVNGHFPCGWQGNFPQGKLVIY